MLQFAYPRYLYFLFQFIHILLMLTKKHTCILLLKPLFLFRSDLRIHRFICNRNIAESFQIYLFLSFKTTIYCSKRGFKGNVVPRALYFLKLRNYLEDMMNYVNTWLYVFIYFLINIFLFQVGYCCVKGILYFSVFLLFVTLQNLELFFLSSRDIFLNNSFFLLKRFNISITIGHEPFIESPILCSS